MFKKIIRLFLCSLFLLAAFFSKDAFSEYLEGIDTTDVNGYGLDSAFRVNGGGISGQNLICYVGWFEGGGGYFNYSFDEIKIAPDILIPTFLNVNYLFRCFLIKKNKDSTYSKVQLLQQISGNRYVYKYGINTTPNDRMLVRPDYDRIVRYKPNNINLHYSYHPDSLTWDPPLANDNHFVGYQLFKTKVGIYSIDTSAPIDLNQWDSVSFTTSNKITAINFSYNVCYLNIMAVYTEGKSDFLKGWTLYAPPLNIRESSSACSRWFNKISIIQTIDGIMWIKLLGNIENSLSFTIQNLIGQKVAHFTGVNGGGVLWNPASQGWPHGMYLLRTELPDHTVLTQPFLFTK